MVKQSLKTTRKYAIVASIITKQKGEALKMVHGSRGKVANEFNISEQTVKRVWLAYVAQKRAGVQVPDLQTKFQERGRNSLLTELMKEHIEEILQDYANLHRYASEEQVTENLVQMGHPTNKSSVHNYLHQMGVTNKTQYIKPLLVEKHKLRQRTS